MIGQIASRLLRMVLTLWVVATLVFLAIRMSGNAVDYLDASGLGAEEREMMIRYFKLDGSMWQQYQAYIAGILQGDFGLSFRERRPVVDMVFERVLPSAQLMLGAFTLTVCLAIPLGVIAAVWRGKAVAGAAMGFAFIGYAVPNFILAILLILVFANWLNWLPIVGNATLAHYILPTIVMSGLMIGAIARFTRNAMLEVLSQDYMRTARAKGLPEWIVVMRHAFGNASLTVLSVVGLQVVAKVAAGSVVVETIFAWPGIGELLVNAAIYRDYNVLQFGVLSVAFAVIILNTLIDLAYTWADPRLRTRAATL